jgi:hypothetical protein
MRVIRAHRGGVPIGEQPLGHIGSDHVFGFFGGFT